MQYINLKTNTVYSGDRAHWTHVPVTSERPSPYHVPVIEDGEHTGWEEDADAQIINNSDYAYSNNQDIPAEVIIIAKRSF